VLRSQRRVAALCALALAAAPAIYMVSDEYFSRMETLKNVEGEASAASRIVFAKVALSMWLDYPFFGVGFGARNYTALSSHYLGQRNILGVHNSYLQLLVDCGIFAFLLYCALLFGTMLWLGRSAKRVKEWSPGSEYIPIAIQAAMLAFSVGAATHSFERYDFPYILMMCAAAWYRVERQLACNARNSVESELDIDDAVPSARLT